MFRNTLVYYLLAIVLPVIGLIFLSKTYNKDTFVICLFVYLLLYRPVIDRFRLFAKGVITKKELWKFHVFGLGYTYFRELYLP